VTVPTRLVLAAGAFVLAAAAIVSWAEAEKEIWALCSTFGPGQERQAVVRTLDTGTRGADAELRLPGTSAAM